VVNTSVGLLKKDEDAIAGNGADNAIRTTTLILQEKGIARPVGE
jgi:hypothetical protein